ncbi:MAG TPA: hypothetical protein ENI95_08625 [Chloroflexi bacterium]|nr:hypothetical protein [Chloroflexota bacterium]
MPSEMLTQSIPTSAKECYDALLEVLPDLGYEIWKTRPIAWLVIARGEIEGSPLTINAMCSMSTPTTLSLTLSSDGVSSEQLQKAGNAILEKLKL